MNYRRENNLNFIDRLTKTQTSWIVLQQQYVAIDTSGHLFDPFAIKTYGYWSWERVAELLPWEYRPPADRLPR